jgi:DNA-binding transcriptional LysR family regulator
MDVRYLNYILAIARKKNITRASEELYVSQSSVSQFLAKLEDEIGTKLFIRAKGKLTLTSAGLLYVKAAEHVVEIQKKLYQDIKNLNSKGHITIGTTSQFGLEMLSEIIPKFKFVFPDVTVEMSEADAPHLTKMILEENIDLGIMSLADLAPFTNQYDILRNEEVLFAVPKTHSYCEINKTETISTDDLITFFKNDIFFRAKIGNSVRILTDKLFASYNFIPNSTSESNSIIMLRNMVANGTGVTFIGESCVADTTKIVYYHLHPRLYRYNALVRRKNWLLTKYEQEFCSYIKNYFPK